MDIPWGSDIANIFITNVGLVTTDGIHGANIMACEWTHHVSYKPGLIAVCIHPRHATYDNIKSSKEFGLSIASTEQTVISSIAGKESGKNFNKIKILEQLGFEFFPAKKIKAMLVKDAVATLECKLIQEILLGDHTMFVGEIVEASLNPEKKPLAYHQGKYWGMNQSLEKPSNELREKIKALFEENKRK